MKIFIAGATGRVANLLIQNLVKKDHQIYAGARKVDKVLQNPNVTPVAMDLHNSVAELAELLQGMDVVYFVAGSRGKDILQTDSFGAVKMMQASEQMGVKRFILLSSIFADQPDKWNDPNLVNITDYNIAKFFADQWLMHQTKLDYTILQPGNLQEVAGTGKIAINVTKSQPNSIENVAAVLAALLEAPNTIHQIVTMSDGDTEINQALMML